MTETGPAASIKAIETRKLVKSFNNIPALRDINLEVNRGESLVVLGPNGAGKTTLIKVLATIMKPTSGEIIINGFKLNRHAGEIRRRTGVVTHETFLYRNLTAYENLEFYCRMYDVPRSEERIQEVADMVAMTPRIRERVGTLSRGMQQRLSIARALLHHPSILFLDEPETGLDQQTLAAIWKALKGDSPLKRTVVLTTHNLERALDLGDRVIILNRGKTVFQKARNSLDLDSLKASYEESTGVKR